MPSLTEALHIESKKRDKLLATKNNLAISKKYGGAEFFKPPVEAPLVQVDRYVEYDQNGRVIKKGHS